MISTDLNLPPVSMAAPAIAHTQHWVADMVVGLNLCPFARAEMVNKRIRYALCAAPDDEAILQTLEAELLHLQATPRAQTETTLIVCPLSWGDFLDMQLFLPHADALLKRLGLRGEIQIAHFHPRFVFAGSHADDDNADVGNYSNRSPHPTLHLIREDAIARAAASMDDPDSIYEANIALLQSMGKVAIEARLAAIST
jgi:hypothetical protein